MAEDGSTAGHDVPVSQGGLRRYQELAARLPGLLEQLRTSRPLQRGPSDAIPVAPGVYLLSEGNVPVYVGQTRTLRRRLRQHGGPTSQHNQASFAFTIARRDAATAGIADLPRSRAELADHPEFRAIFTRARERVAKMSVRFVAIPEPELRTIFEVYAAAALGTGEYNSFETH